MIYFVADVVKQKTGYISIKMIGVGLLCLPIVAITLDFFQLKVFDDILLLWKY